MPKTFLNLLVIAGIFSLITIFASRRVAAAPLRCLSALDQSPDPKNINPRKTTLSEYGKTKLQTFLSERNSTLWDDLLVQYIVKNIAKGSTGLAFYESSTASGRNFGIRRSLRADVSYVDGVALVKVFNINAEPLTFYEIDPNDNTTLKVISALILAMQNRRDIVKVQLKISSFVNVRYYEAMERWGFIPVRENELAVDLYPH